MAISTVDEIVAAYGSVQTFNTFENSATTVAGQPYSMWMGAGNPGAPTANPPALGEAPTNATVGCNFPFTNPGGSNLSYLSRLAITDAQAGLHIIYDRLYHFSGLSGVLTTPQTCPAVALTRYTSGVGVEIYLECYTACGATSTTFTVKYTNQAGASGRTGTFVGTIHVAGYMGNVILQAGDTGVQSVQSVQLTATSGTAGSFGVTLVKRIAEVPVIPYVGAVLDPFALGMPQIQNSACLAQLYVPSTTSTGLVFISADIIQG